MTMPTTSFVLLGAFGVCASSPPAGVNETQEVPAYREPETDFVAHAVTPAAADGPAYVAEEVVQHAVTTAQTQQLDMEALVARVLAKMNPDVLQRVTQEILKPVIEALIKDELASKK